MQTTLKILLSGLIFSTCISCGDDGDFEIAEQTLQGEINGEMWEFKFGYVERFVESDGTVDVVLLGIPVGSPYNCTAPPGANPKIVFYREDKVGGGSLSSQKNVTFVYERDGTLVNDFAYDGAWRFDSVTGDKILGGLVAEVNGNHVNGTFEIDRCGL